METLSKSTSEEKGTEEQTKKQGGSLMTAGEEPTEQSSKTSAENSNSTKESSGETLIAGVEKSDGLKESQVPISRILIEYRDGTVAETRGDYANRWLWAVEIGFYLISLGKIETKLPKRMWLIRKPSERTRKRWFSRSPSEEEVAK